MAVVALDRSSEVEVKFQSHHWPCWGNTRVVDELETQRDVYKYLHDQSVHLMNQGYVGEEIAEMIRLPPRARAQLVHPGLLRHDAAQLASRVPALHGLV
jgi:alkyl sulfatase BDS1-like metallo-beta-lactamase superfamily hydrolase